MKSIIKTVVQDYGWIHTGLGTFGNLTFFVGSIFFLPSFKPLQTVGVCLFILGSLLMLVGAIGEFFVKIYEAEECRNGGRARA